MRCANPACHAEAIYFRSGSLHWVDDPFAGREAKAPAELHLIWLCAECSRSCQVETWRPAGQQIRSGRGEVVPMCRQKTVKSSQEKPQIPAS